MSARLARERARSVVATPQERLFRARVALKQAATLVREACSLGTMAGNTRASLTFLASLWADTDVHTLKAAELAVNEHQSSLRARRSRKAT